MVKMKLGITPKSLMHDPEEKFSKKNITKNIAVVCCGIVMILTAIEGPSVLQSTMNKKEGIGVITSAILYTLYSINGLLLPKYVLKRFGSKRTLSAAMLAYAFALLGNVYPEWSVLIPTAILNGFAGPLLYTAQESYLKDISVMFAALSESDKNHIGKTICVKKNSKSLVISQKNATDPKPNPSHNLVIEKYSSTELSNATTQKLPFDRCLANSCTETSCKCELGIAIKQNMSSDLGHHMAHSSPRNFSECSKKSFINQCLSIEDDTENIQGANLNAAQTDDVKTLSESDMLMRKNEVESITARVFGIHGMSLLSGHLWGSVLSHFLLTSDVDPTSIYNRTNCLCGSEYCNSGTNCMAETLEEISNRTRYTLVAACFCIAVVAVVIVTIFLDPLREKGDQTPTDFRLLKAAFLIAKRMDSVLLMPSSFYIGQIQGFYQAEFTKAYISCAWSMHRIALVSICYGLFCAIASISSGWMVKLFGRLFVNTFSIILNIATCILLLLWKPDASNPTIFFVASGMIGTFVGIVYSQSRAFYGILFKEEKEAAFGVYHVWYALGFSLSFAYSTVLCTSIKIYVLLVISTLGYFGYVHVERKFSSKIP